MRTITAGILVLAVASAVAGGEKSSLLKSGRTVA